MREYLKILKVLKHLEGLEIYLWIERICERQASNQTVADWCDTNGVNMKTYYYWMRKIKCEAFDALPTERKTRALSTPFSKTTFAEIPREQMAPVAIPAMVLHLGTATLEIQKPVQVLRESGKKNTADSYMWVYGSIKDSKSPIHIFDYQSGRSGKYPQQFLKGYKGYIHIDAYKGYEKVTGVTRCFCWTHLRRYFIDALPKDIERPQDTIPAQAIRSMNKLFEIEKNWRYYHQKDKKNSVEYRKSLYWRLFGHGLKKHPLIFYQNQNQEWSLPMLLILSSLFEK